MYALLTVFALALAGLIRQRRYVPARLRSKRNKPRQL